jgi:hypothetical protein
MSLMKRSVINPVLVISGGLMVLSGFFLMFHYESHFAKAIHQIGGVLFVIFGIMHIVINNKALINSLKGRISIWVVVVIFVVSIMIMAVTGDHTPHHKIRTAHVSALNSIGSTE